MTDPILSFTVYKKIRLIRSLKKFIFRYQDLVEIYSVSAEKIIKMDFHIVKMYKDKVSTKMSKIFFLSMCDVKAFLTFGTDLTTVLPVLFKYRCKYCYSDSRKL